MSQSQPDAIPEKLHDIQHWMLTAITSPGGLSQGLSHARQSWERELEEIVATPAGVSPHSRLDIYAQGYWLRLFACLKADYPALLRLLGDGLFEFFARAYLEQWPSQSFSLYGLGDGFARFLRNSQSAAARSENGDALNFAFDLARIEQAMAAAQRAQGLEATTGTIADPVQLLLGGDITIELPATTRLLLTHHPLSSFQPWLSGSTTHAAPQAHTGYIAIKRLRYRVSCLELNDWQFHFLAAARRRKRPLRACLENAARRTRSTLPELLAKLAFWLPGAQADGLLGLN